MGQAIINARNPICAGRGKPTFPSTLIRTKYEVIDLELNMVLLRLTQRLV